MGGARESVPQEILIVERSYKYGGMEMHDCNRATDKEQCD